MLHCTGFSLVPRAVATVGRVVITIFRQCDGYTTHFYVFWDADSESDIKNFEFETVTKILNSKKMIARAIYFFKKYNGGPKKSKLDDFNEKGSSSLQMMRECQIWS